MGKSHAPRSGSMQFWPRVRAKREYARTRSWATVSDVKLLGFAGYKVCMTHVIAIENKKTSPNKGATVSIPVTIIECPPLKILGARFYKADNVGTMNPAIKVMFKADEEVKRKLVLSKKSNESEKVFAELGSKLSEYNEMTVIVNTMPSKTGIGKKKPEVFEIAIGGTIEQKYDYVKSNIGKEISIKDVFSEGLFVDTKSVTKGKGYQGAVKRFGVSIRQHKSEKVKRGVGTLGGWSAQQHFMYRVAHAGKMGYHLRTEYNKLILKISENPADVNPKGGFINYGLVKNNCVIVKGSVGGPKKRLIRLDYAIRPTEKMPADVPSIRQINLDSKQGN